MPLTELFQEEVLSLIAANRSPDNYVAGAIVIHQQKDSPRFSQDMDLFHDAAEAVAQSATADAAVLNGHGFKMEWLLQQPSFVRGIVSRGEESLRLEWAYDSAFRFFPAEKDPRYGYRLHMADVATNKVLALASRQEMRDTVDVLHLDATYLSLGAICWAACGKDAGFTPDFLLDQIGRHARFSREDLQRLALARPLDPIELKKQWLSVVERAVELIEELPVEDAGCLYLNRDGAPVSPDPTCVEFKALVRHFGSIKGAWPRVV
jgi:hypothetical protein